jgi:transitional endoplasmic reticulum ATPase
MIREKKLTLHNNSITVFLKLCFCILLINIFLNSQYTLPFMAILTTGQTIGRYEVLNLIKENIYTESYHVKSEDKDDFFLKLFVLERLPERLLDKETGKVTETELSQGIHNVHYLSHIDDGTYESGDIKCQYYVTEYMDGTLLSETIRKEGKLDEETAIAIFKDILEGLKYLHNEGLCHNDITSRNIMLPRLDKMAKIIDPGHISKRCSGKVPFDTADLDIEYCANETFASIFDEQSDIFSACAVLYAMLFGDAPWKSEAPEGVKRGRAAMLMKEKRAANPIDFGALSVDDRIKAVLSKGLSLAYGDRYKSVDQILRDLDASSEVPPIKPSDTPGADSRHKPDSEDSLLHSPNETEFEVKRGGGNGFADIAGMGELKRFLTERVIFVIKNKEMAAKYRLTPPNGMLFYGPPGCGKTFMAEKFAEETGFNFILVKASDVGSSFVHGSQEKIAKLFATAEKDAPVVICFDEFDALVPDRSIPANQYQAGEVNEFLTQLNNCSKRGIFVIGTTNRPDKIDPAALRTGRIDRQVYIPLPDAEARREMFAIHLKGRPFNEKEIDLGKLSEMTDGYIASDIAYVVNDAALVAAFSQQDITEAILESAVQNIRPSLRQDTMSFYDHIHEMMENTERRNALTHKIGFIINN